MFSMEEMKEKTRLFYSRIGCELNEDNIELAVQSLTMPCYANEYVQQFNTEIRNHLALATVGDEYWGAYVLSIEFSPSATEGELTEDIKKSIASNAVMNGMSKKWLLNSLFHSNNDLTDNNSKDEKDNKKGYATALEAVVGFLFLEYPDKVLSVLKEKFPKEDLEKYIKR